MKRIRLLVICPILALSSCGVISNETSQSKDNSSSSSVQETSSINNSSSSNMSESFSFSSESEYSWPSSSSDNSSNSSSDSSTTSSNESSTISSSESVTTLPQLDTPNVEYHVLLDDGRYYLSWDEVPNATKYRILTLNNDMDSTTIDRMKENTSQGTFTDEITMSIDEGMAHDYYSFIVQAIGDGISYSNSSWSKRVTYSDAVEFRHVHTPSDYWGTTKTNHYHYCIQCGEKIEEGEHIFGEWAPESEDSPNLIRHCSVCDYYELKENDDLYNFKNNPNLRDPAEVITSDDYKITTMNGSTYILNESQRADFLSDARRSRTIGFINGKNGIVKSNDPYLSSDKDEYAVKNYKLKSYTLPEFKKDLASSCHYLEGIEKQLHKKYQNEDNIIYRTVGSTVRLTYPASDENYNCIEGLMTEYIIVNDPNNALEIDVYNSVYNLEVYYRLKNAGEATIQINWLNGDQVLDSTELKVRVYPENASIGEEVITIKEALERKQPGPVTIRAYALNNLLIDETGYMYVGSFVFQDNGRFSFTSTESGSGYIEITGYMYDGYFYDTGVRRYIQPTNIRVIKQMTGYFSNDYPALLEKAHNVMQTPLWLDTELYVRKAADENVDVIPVEFIYWGEDGKIYTSFMDDDYLRQDSVSIPREVTGINGSDLGDFVPGTYYLFKGFLVQNYENWQHINSPTFILESREIVSEAALNTPVDEVQVEDVTVKQYENAFVEFSYNNNQAYKDRGVYFDTSDEDIFTVDYQGKITAKGIGQATLYVTTRSGIIGASTVTVIENDNNVPVSEISFASNMIEVDVGDTVEPLLNVYPLNASLNRSISYESSDDTVLAVSNGKLVGLKAGYVTLTATCGDLSASTRVLVNIKANNNSYSIDPIGADPNIHNLTSVDNVYDVVNQSILNHYSSTTFRYDYVLNADYSDSAIALKNELQLDIYQGQTAHQNGEMTLFDYIATGTLQFNNVKITVSMSEEAFDKDATEGHFDITLNFEYLTDSASIDKKRVSTHINSTSITNLKSYVDQTLRNNRDIDFNDFTLFNENKGTLDVSNSNELVYALSNGYIPNFTKENSEAERLYNKMLAVLRNIITTDMSDVMRIQAIYEYVCSLQTNQYTEYYLSTLLNGNTIKDLYGNENTFFSPDDHAYMTQYLESWDSENGIGFNAMHKLLAALLGIEGFETITNYAPIIKMYYDETDNLVIWNYYVPLTQIEIDGNYYYFSPQNDKDLDCSSVYSQTLYRGFLLPTSQTAFCDALSSGLLNYVKVIGKGSSNYATTTLQEAVDDYSSSLKYGFIDAKQFTNSEYDYRINSEEELTALCNDIAESGFKGLGYVTIELGYQMGFDLIDAREHIFNAIDNSNLNLNPAFFVSAKKEIGDNEDAYKESALVEEFRSHPGYILGNYYISIVDSSFTSFDLATRITITFNIV